MIGHGKSVMSRYARVLNPATTSPWAYHINYFTQQECAHIIQLGLQLPVVEGNLGENRNIDRNIRVSTVSFFDSTSAETSWIFDKVQSAVDTFNRQFWRFDLKYIECLQFSRYENPGDFYTSHMDMYYATDEVRKLSLSVQLSDPGSYQGSDLMMFGSGENYSCAPREQGTIIMFPSYHVHKVTALESGTRYSLVSWVIGEPFK